MSKRILITGGLLEVGVDLAIRGEFEEVLADLSLLPQEDDPGKVTAWRQRLKSNGVWANQPVPVFFYPGSPGYTQRWGEPDDMAWERAHEHYIGICSTFCDLQDQHPLPLPRLEEISG